MDSSSKPTSRSTVYHKKKQEVAPLQRICLSLTPSITKRLCRSASWTRKCITKASFLDEGNNERSVINTAESMHPLQTSPKCTTIYEKTGFEEFFRMKPCEVDARRVHELITTLEENGTCTLTNKDGEQVMRCGWYC